MNTNTSTSPKRTTSKQSSQSSQSTKVPKLAGNEDMIASVVRFPGMEQPLLVSMPSNLPSLQGVLNPPNPRCLRGRESVIQNLQHSGKEAVPLDHDLFSQYRRHTPHTSVTRRAGRSSRRSSRGNHPINRQQPPPLFQQFHRGTRSTLEQQQDAMRMKLQSNALMNWNHLVSALACTQLQKIQTTLLQQQLTIMESSPSESNEIQPGEVARKVTKMKSASNLFSAGALTNSPPHVRSMKDKQSYRYSQRSYMRMISEKYDSIRVWKHKSGRVEVKIKKITNGKGKYIDLYPEDKSGYYDFPTDVSEWYEGAWMRGPPGVGRQVYDSRQSGIVDLDHIDEKLRIDPWMYDDLVYMFVYGDVKFCNEGETTKEYISVPSLPPHMQVDDDLTLPRQTLFARPERKKRSDEGNYEMVTGETGRNGGNGEMSERDLSEVTNHDDQIKNESGEQPSFMKYTTQLMSLPEICMIGANEDKKSNTNENTEESKKEELVQNSFDFDDAASEESLFREIAYVVERRGDLSGSSACNSGEDASPPSLTDAPSSISPNVQSEIAMLFDDESKIEKEEEKDQESDISWSSNTMDETTDFCSHENKIFAGSFIRRDLWTPREETKLDPISSFNESSIWRMEDSVFEYSNDSST